MLNHTETLLVTKNEPWHIMLQGDFMLEAFLLIIVALLTIVGLSEIIHMACSFVLKPKTIAQKFLVIVLTENDAENQTLEALEEMRWQGTRYAETLVAVTEKLSNETKSVCQTRFIGRGIIFTDDIGVLQHKFRSN